VLLGHPAQAQWYFYWNAAPALAIGSAAGVAMLWDRVDRRRTRLALAAVGGGLAAMAAPQLVPEGASTETTVVRVALTRLLVLLAIVALTAFVAWVIPAHGGPRRASVGAVVSVSLILLATIPTVIDQITTPLPAERSPVNPGSPGSVSSDQIEAARWLRDHSGTFDVVATNRHCAAASSQRCQARRFFVSAYSERRVLVEGWAYTSSWHASPDGGEGRLLKSFWNPELLALNDSAFEVADPAVIAALAEMGVRWLFVDKTVPFSAELGLVAMPRYETEWSWVLEVP
jgi:hypothetical protein